MSLVTRRLAFSFSVARKMFSTVSTKVNMQAAPTVFTKDPHLKYECNSKNTIILEPALYFDRQPHENCTEKFVKFFNHWLKVTDDKARLIYEAFDIFLAITSICDDIEDSSVIRRGVKSVHEVYGVPYTLFSVNYISLVTLNKIDKLDHPRALSTYLEEVKEYYLNDCIQFNWKLTSKYPTTEEYLEVTSKKVYAYLQTCAGLLNLFTTSPKDLSKIIYLVGEHIVLCDDHNNLKSEEYYKYHGFCDDIRDGRVSYPILHAIHNSKYADKIISILKMKTSDEEIKKDLLKMLEDSGSFKVQEKKIQEVRANIDNEVKKLGDNPYVNDILGIVKY